MSYIGSEVRQGKAVRTSYSASGGETSVNVTYTPGQLSVYLNGVKLVGGGDDYTATNGTSITGLSPALTSGDIVEFIALDTFTAADMVPASTGGTFTGNVTHSGEVNLTNKAGIKQTSPTSPAGSNAFLHIGNSSLADASLVLEDDGAKWEFLSNDSLMIRDNNATRMTIDSAGRVTKPEQPSCNVKFNSNSNDGAYSGSTNGIAKYAGVRHNVGSHYDTSNGRFTCPVDGKYLVTFNNNWYSGSAHGGGAPGGWVRPDIRLNGTIVHQFYDEVTDGTSWHQISGGVIIDASASDYIEQGLATASGVGGGGDINQYSSFCITLLN